MFSWWKRKARAATARITWGDRVVSVSDKNGTTRTFRWDDLRSVTARKEDCFGVDTICIDCEHGGEPGLVHLNEEMEGYKLFIEELQRRCTGFRPDWWNAVTFPAFAENRTLIWQRPEPMPGEPALGITKDDRVT